MIRRATESDATAIAQVHLATWRSTYGGIVAQDHIDSLTVDAYSTRWRSRLIGSTNPPPTVLVATDVSGDIIGFTSGGTTRENSLPFDAELYAIYVLQECQGRGIGRSLVNDLVGHLLEHGHTSLCVSVLTNNPARLFYERLGGKWIRNVSNVIGGSAYPATWYGWDDLRTLKDQVTDDRT
jgi:ribosomal protein S18 acetylase RimI-like enzyme